jgi:hypothetical protein
MGKEQAVKRYVVIGKYITVKTMTPDGMQVRGLHQGAPLPLDVDQESIAHHLAVGLIEEIPQAAPPTPAEIADAAAARVAAAESALAAAESELDDAKSAQGKADAAAGRKVASAGSGPGAAGSGGSGSGASGPAGKTGSK